MPTILRIKGYRFWFYSADLREPAHVHVGRGGKEAKYWIDPTALARAGRFSGVELRDIERILVEYRPILIRAWERETLKRDDNTSAD